jgi:hypothetical protein
MEITKQIAKNPLPWIIQAIGLVIVIANLYLASKLTPLAQDIDRVINRVHALEERNAKIDPELKEMYTLKEKIYNIEKTVDKIADRLEVYR